jgi:hypothetical protein
MDPYQQNDATRRYGSSPAPDPNDLRPLYVGPSPAPMELHPNRTGASYDHLQRYASHHQSAPPVNQWNMPPVISNAPTVGTPGGIYMPDPRLSSPPPLLHHSSSQQSGLLLDGQAQNMYPIPSRPYSPFQHNSHDGRITPGADLADEPLLHRQDTGDGRYGNAFNGSSGLENGHQGTNFEEPVTMRYGPAPDRMLRRHKTTKRVQ